MKALASLSLLATLGSAAFAQNLVVSGELTSSDPTFRRPRSSTTLVSPTGSGIKAAYDVISFTVSASGQYTAEMAAPRGTNLDTYLLVYRDAFDPANALTNLVNGNDNGAGSLTVLPTGASTGGGKSRIALGEATDYNATGLALVTGTTYYAVATAYGDNSTTYNLGAYTLGIGGGPGTVSGIDAVPEPATMAVLGLGAAALLRRKRRSA